MRRIVEVIFFVALVLVLISFGGALHGIGDSLAVFRFWLALVLVGASVLLMTGRRGLVAAILAVVVIAAMPVSTGYLAPAPSGELRYTVYQKNLLYKNVEDDRITADLLEADADFITLQEIFHTNEQIFDALDAVYASSLICPFAGVGQVAVLSHWPKIPGSDNCGGNKGLAAMQVETPAGPVWIVSVHLNWPYPYNQPEQVAALAGVLNSLGGRVVLGGDFNMVPWSHTVRAISKATGSDRAGPMVRTLIHSGGILRLPIDHVLVPGGIGKLETRPLLGSDHLGLLLAFDL